ncbi:galectin-8-like [Astyanax mexicanus]|uniref:Galectin n=1 Tax=Astyanax mexicanus TaxID=7994 RepID=A0A8T2KQN4_ASTMX|nr:galectin-8-like [Astyanax mexicanus]
MADQTKFFEVLQKVLENLTSEDLVKFNTHLIEGVVDYYPVIPKPTLQFAIVQANLSEMVKAYGTRDTAEICEITLRIMNHRDLAQSLAGIKGSLYPVVPYAQVLHDGLKNQTVITIQGQVKSNADQFQINLHKDSDIAFHFNPRFNENGKQVIVRNSLMRYAWGPEERELSVFPFTPGKPFEVKILCTDAEFRVEVDKKPLLNFTHRIKEINQIRKLTVERDVFIKQVTIDPIPLWMTPQSTDVLNDVISENMNIIIPLHVKPNAKVFSINLIKDDENNILFHMKPMFSDDGKGIMIVRNSKVNGVWGSEERDTPSFTFACGKSFLVKILCTSKEFKVFVDGKFLLEFKYRQFDFTKINKVGIREDVIAWGVQVEPCTFLYVCFNSYLSYKK